MLGHNLLDRIAPEWFGALAPLWRALHVPGPLEVVPVFLLYPIHSLVGVMALGYAAAPRVFAQGPAASQRLAWAGAVLILLFLVLRWFDVYGDSSPRLDEGGAALLAMSFLNLAQYPPSMLYLLMTLGPALLALAWLRHASGPIARLFVTFGRVLSLFYVAHLYLVHAIAVGAGAAQGYPASAMRDIFLGLPDGYGFGLTVV